MLMLTLVVVCAALVGCSSSAGPRVWAASVCNALAPWRAEIGTLATRTQQQMTAATTPAQAKENLVRLFSGAEAASESARAGVEKAGVPDVEQGAEIASSFQASLTGVRDAYGRARGGIEALATSPQATFYTHVAAVVEKLDEEYDKTSLDTSQLSSAELKQAFDDTPECR